MIMDLAHVSVVVMLTCDRHACKLVGLWPDQILFCFLEVFLMQITDGGYRTFLMLLRVF